MFNFTCFILISVLPLVFVCVCVFTYYKNVPSPSGGAVILNLEGQLEALYDNDYMTHAYR